MVAERAHWTATTKEKKSSNSEMPCCAQHFVSSGNTSCCFLYMQHFSGAAHAVSVACVAKLMMIITFCKTIPEITPV